MKSPWPFFMPKSRKEELVDAIQDKARLPLPRLQSANK